MKRTKKDSWNDRHWLGIYWIIFSQFSYQCLPSPLLVLRGYRRPGDISARYGNRQWVKIWWQYINHVHTEGAAKESFQRIKENSSERKKNVPGSSSNCPLLHGESLSILVKLSLLSIGVFVFPLHWYTYKYVGSSRCAEWKRPPEEERAPEKLKNLIKTALIDWNRRMGWDPFSFSLIWSLFYIALSSPPAFRWRGGWMAMKQDVLVLSSDWLPRITLWDHRLLLLLLLWLLHTLVFSLQSPRVSSVSSYSHPASCSIRSMQGASLT